MVWTFLGEGSKFICDAAARKRLSRYPLSSSDAVKALIDKAYKHCEEILRRDADKLRDVVQFLLDNETMTGAQFAQCMAGETIAEAGETSLFDAFTKSEETEEE